MMSFILKAGDIEQSLEEERNQEQEHFKNSETTDKFFRDKFPSYYSVIVPGHRSAGQETGRAKAGLGQLCRKKLAVKRDRVTSKHYRVQAQVLHLPSTTVLWINTYLPILTPSL